MRSKRLKTCLVVITVVAIAILSYQLKTGEIDDNGTNILGPSGNVVLNTGFPKKPATLPIYEVLHEYYREIGRPTVVDGDWTPSKEEALLIAQGYLEANGLLIEHPEQNETTRSNIIQDVILKSISYYNRTVMMMDGQVVKREIMGIQICYKRTIGNLAVVGPGDEIELLIGRNKEVLYYSATWRTIREIGKIEIIDAEKAFENLISGKNLIGETELSMGKENIRIDNISLGYYAFGAGVKQEFYKPVWIFYGKANNRDTYFAVAAYE
ncbi:MAG: hypothetical protein DRP50_07755 [Thermotoga sp.]|nr:MAG: hypothetical protein DRP50_07755 [Thermotoga sp.]